jgi:osmoprotectant transport system permease protein
MKREAVSLLGLAALLSSFVLPALNVKPNRVAEGTLQSLWSIATPTIIVLGVLFVTLTIVAGAITGVPAWRRYVAVKLTAAAALLPLLFALLGSGSTVALERGGMDAGRVGPALGWWLGAVGAYVLLYDARRRIVRAGPERRAAVRTATAATTAAIIAVLWLFRFQGLGVVQEYVNRASRFWEEFGSHLMLSGASVGGAVVIGVPLGMLAFRSKRAVRPVFSVTSGLQTIPSLALFGLMIAPLAFLSRQLPMLRAMGIRGVGNAPAIIALTLYGLLPIVRNTYVGLKSIDQGVIDAGRGMGMSRGELLRLVQIPIALPIILTGLRITAVQTVGNAAVAALIGARGLGNFVFQGLGQAAPDLIVLGALPIVALAVVVDRGMDALIRALKPGPEQEKT